MMTYLNDLLTRCASSTSQKKHPDSSSHDVISRILLLVSLILGVNFTVRADVTNVGVLSFDVVNPGATNAFTVYNLTGPFSLPPDFPISDSLNFTGISLSLTQSGITTPYSLSDLGPGSEQLLALSTDSFTQATFQATLSQTVFT
jgi:hypothetical protein